MAPCARRLVQFAGLVRESGHETVLHQPPELRDSVLGIPYLGLCVPTASMSLPEKMIGIAPVLAQWTQVAHEDI
jgi:hypothetical protein